MLQCGIPAERIVFSGVGKTDAEIEAGIDARILAFNAESGAGDREDRRASPVPAAPSRGSPCRVNPDIDAKSHPYISTGLKQNKFGVDIARARTIFEWARN